MTEQEEQEYSFTKTPNPEKTTEGLYSPVKSVTLYRREAADKLQSLEEDGELLNFALHLYQEWRKAQLMNAKLLDEIDNITGNYLGVEKDIGFSNNQEDDEKELFYSLLALHKLGQRSFKDEKVRNKSLTREETSVSDYESELISQLTTKLSSGVVSRVVGRPKSTVHNHS
jgi:hypothetical protein